MTTEAIFTLRNYVILTVDKIENGEVTLKTPDGWTPAFVRLREGEAYCIDLSIYASDVRGAYAADIRKSLGVPS